MTHELQKNPFPESNWRLRRISISGYGQEDDRRRTREAGFHHHLLKPIDQDALDELLMRNVQAVKKHL